MMILLMLDDVHDQNIMYVFAYNGVHVAVLELESSMTSRYSTDSKNTLGE
jgi:hypothetical protein